MEIHQNLRIFFVLVGTKGASPNETRSIYCRITLGKNQSRFSTGFKIPINLWSQKLQQAEGNIPLAKSINKKIADLIRKIESINATFELSHNNYDVDDILNKLLGRDTAPFRTLIQVYEYKLKQMSLLVGKDYKAVTIEKAIQMQKVVTDFLRDKHSLTDISLSKVNVQFLNEFEFYLKSDRKMATASSNKIIQKLKAMMKLAFDYGVLDRPAFPNHKFKHEQPKVIFLTMEELAVLERSKFAQERLAMIRDLFLFSVYTGLHYIDAMNLTEENIIKGVDGKKWISFIRQKTNVDINIPLLDKAQQLLCSFKEKYDPGVYLLPRFSNQKINSYLKEIAELLGINKPLSHKVARKTFGSVLLYYNVPMKVVSKLMGHSSVIITERHYAQVELKKLGLEMDQVAILLSTKINLS